MQPVNENSLSRLQQISSLSDSRLIFPVREPLFSVYVQDSVRIRKEGYLSVLGGDRVTIMNTANLPTGTLFCKASDQTGKVPYHLLRMDGHSANIYLEAIDFLVDHPKFFKSFLEREHPQMPDCCSQIVTLLSARKTLQVALEKLFRDEILDSRNRRLEGEAFRGMTAATLVTGAILKSPGKLQGFRTNFVEFAISKVKRLKGKACQPKECVSIVKMCIDYLTDLPNYEIPNELTHLLKALKSVTDSDANILFGSVFFLRFINPALVQPTDNLSSEVKSGLKQLAKMFQLIANQVNPVKGQDAYQIREDLKKLWSPTGAFLDKVASLPLSHSAVDQSTIIPAATVYALLAKLGEHIDEPALFALKNRLGTTPQLPIQQEKEVPMFGEIIRIMSYIRKQSNKRIKE